MAVLYVLHTGNTKDAKGKEIWIDGDKLSRLYGVPISQCLIMNPDKVEELKDLVPNSATHLYIKEDGIYPQYF